MADNMSSEQRFRTESGTEVFTGNELLVKGALETTGGVHLLAGYPGSPIAGFFDTLSLLKDMLQEKGIRAAINNNEALAAAMLNGTQTLPARAMVVMKSVGVHVAADGLALGNLAGTHREGGAIVVYGDDPWSDSTQVAADSRFISKHLFIPVIEPSNPQEVKDFVDLAFQLSRRSELFAGYVITTNLADGGGTVTCKPNQFPRLNMLDKLDLDTGRIDLNKRVLLPPKTWWQEESLASRFQTAMDVASELGLNKLEYSAPAAGGRKPIGFVSAGLGYDYLVQALHELGQLGQYPILKFGLSYPVDPKLIKELGRQCERIVVVEERRGFLEEQIAEIVIADRQAGGPLADVELYGKKFPDGMEGIPATRGLHPSILVSLLAPLLKKYGVGGDVEAINRQIDTLRATERVEVAKLPVRLASFCPGCPHRDTASLCLDIKRKFMDQHYMKSIGRKPVDLLFHGDTGCYTMLMYPPNTDLMHDYSGMGLGGGTGSGIDPFVTNKKVVFMGDSTFFHSGQIAISQAINLQQDITFIILENSTTAMTGHQPHPGVDYDMLGNLTPRQDIETIVRSMGGAADVPVHRVDPEKREEYCDLLEHVFLADGVKVIVADKECGITRTRRSRREERNMIRRKGFLPSRQYMNVNTEICRFCLACEEITGCPGLRHVDSDYGKKIDTDPSWCVNDGACERVGACDAFERITVLRKRPQKSKVPELGLDNIPEPTKRPVGDLWRGCLTGVGGMGIGLATSILVRAGHNEGYKVIFLDKKGLAIRNGGVVSQVVFNISDQPITALIGYGQADLLLGVDILEAARILDPAHRMRIVSKQQTAAVINTDKISTIVGLMGREDYNPDELVELIRQHTRSEFFLARNISRICEKYLGGKIYANIMMLGYAFQQGLIPVSMHSMAWAIKESIRVDFRKNLYAFNMGRKLVVQPDLFQGPPQRLGWRETLEEKCRNTIRRYGRQNSRASELRDITTTAVEKLGELDEPQQRDIVVRAYDCMRWCGLDYTKKYLDALMSVYEKDRPEYNYAATVAVLQNLAEAMLIKDCVFKAELATSPEKYLRDFEKYNVNPANGDRIRYRRLWNINLKFGRWKWHWDLTLFDWQLHLLKRSHWLRTAFKPLWSLQRRHLRQYESKVAAFEYSSADEYSRQVLRLSSPLCMDCAAPSCSQTGCPLSADIPVWVKLAGEGHYKDAARRLHEKNNFPEFTAKLCPAFCQEDCKGALHEMPVQVRDAEDEIVEKAFAEGWITPAPSKTKTGKKVAVVGSGPAGLATAQQLARLGHAVTVFEKDPLPGGLLRYGIPDFRLEKRLIDRRLEQLQAEGVQFDCDATVGKEISAGTLLRDFDALCLAVGASRSRDLSVPGRDRAGVVYAMDFLKHHNLVFGDDHIQAVSAVSAKDKNVVVIGGGLTGEDCVETALLQGAKAVRQLEILPRQQAQPAAWLLVDEPEGVERHWSVLAKEFLGDDGQLGGLSVVKVKYTPSAAGPIMEEVPGSEFRVPADLVILALGFDARLDTGLAGQLDLATDEGGKVWVNENFATNVEGVFAAGDLVTGAGYVATAIDSGRRAAERIHQYLSK